MDFHLTGLGYLDGARVVTVTDGLPKSDGALHQQQAQFALDDCPEVAALFERAVEQVGGPLSLAVEKQNAEAKPDTPPPMPVKQTTLAAVVKEKARLVKAEEDERKRRDKEAADVEAALKKENGNG